MYVKLDVRQIYADLAESKTKPVEIIILVKEII